MTVSGRLGWYVGIGVAGIFVALLLGRPEPAVVGAPFLVLAALALLAARGGGLSAELTLERERLIEGDVVRGRVVVIAREGLPEGRVALALPRGLRLLTPAGQLAFSLPSGGRWEAPVDIACDHWGGYPPAEVVLRGSDRAGLFRSESRFEGRSALRVYPSAEKLRRPLGPRRTQVFAGNRVARLAGEGIEFADIRTFFPGDLVRRVNWRVTARRGDLHVNQMHPERNADVVVFLDTFADLRGSGVSTLDLAVRGAAAILERQLATRDRVGLLAFGGTLRWLRPATGQAQLYRVVDSLIDTHVVPSYAWRGVELIPRRVLPPGSLVVALTPLLDERSIAALADLRARGHDIVIVELMAESFVEPGRGEADRLAFRLWSMEREALRARFNQLGVPVVPWRPGEPLADALEMLREVRRSTRPLPF